MQGKRILWKALHNSIKNKRVLYNKIGEKGRGRALRETWVKYNSDINLYMDVDLATDLKALKKVVAAFERGAEVVIGNRYDKKSKTNRTMFRLALSKVYNLLVKLFFWNKRKS